MATLKTLGGFGAGAGATLAIRQALDEPRSRSVFRPSVLHGIGVGAAALGASMLVENRRIDAPVFDRDTFIRLADGYGNAAITSGLFSLIYPRGATDWQKPVLSG